MASESWQVGCLKKLTGWVPMLYLSTTINNVIVDMNMASYGQVIMAFQCIFSQKNVI